MKKVLFNLCSVTFIIIGPLISYGQSSKSEKNNQEIIILKKGVKDQKLTIEMKGKDILINGKPASEFKEEGVSVKTFHTRDRNDFLEGHGFSLSPRAGIGNNFSYWNDGSEGGNKAFLGISTEKTDNGVKITNVMDASPAEKAGLKEGDVITMIGNKKILEAQDVVNEVRSHKPKDEVKIKYVRNEEAGETKAILNESKGFMKSFSFSNSGNGEHFFNLQPNATSINRTPGILNMFWSGNHKLGVRIEDLDAGSGVKITHVEIGSAAENAGLKKDDIITEVDGKKVKDVNEVRAGLMSVKDRSSYTVKATRNGTEAIYEIKIPKQKNNADL